MATLKATVAALAVAAGDEPAPAKPPRRNNKGSLEGFQEDEDPNGELKMQLERLERRDPNKELKEELAALQVYCDR